MPYTVFVATDLGNGQRDNLEIAPDSLNYKDVKAAIEATYNKEKNVLDYQVQHLFLQEDPHNQTNWSPVRHCVPRNGAQLYAVAFPRQEAMPGPIPPARRPFANTGANASRGFVEQFHPAQQGFSPHNMSASRSLVSNSPARTQTLLPSSPTRALYTSATPQAPTPVRSVPSQPATTARTHSCPAGSRSRGGITGMNTAPLAIRNGADSSGFSPSRGGLRSLNQMRTEVDRAAAAMPPPMVLPPDLQERVNAMQKTGSTTLKNHQLVVEARKEHRNGGLIGGRLQPTLGPYSGSRVPSHHNHTDINSVVRQRAILGAKGEASQYSRAIGVQEAYTNRSLAPGALNQGGLISKPAPAALVIPTGSRTDGSERNYVNSIVRNEIEKESIILDPQWNVDEHREHVRVETRGFNERAWSPMRHANSMLR